MQAFFGADFVINLSRPGSRRGARRGQLTEEETAILAAVKEFVSDPISGDVAEVLTRLAKFHPVSTALKTHMKYVLRTVDPAHLGDMQKITWHAFDSFCMP